MSAPTDGIWPPPTPEHAALIAKAKEAAETRSAPALRRLKELGWIYGMAAKLSLRDLERLNGILKRLDEADLKRVAAFAEGLAEWSSGDAISSDG